MSRLPAPLEIHAPHKPASHWAWLAIWIDRLIRSIPQFEQIPSEDPSLYARLLAMVTAAECTVRRLLLIMATALEPQPAPEAPPRTTPKPLQTPAMPADPPALPDTPLDFTALLTTATNAPDRFPLTERPPGPGAPRRQGPSAANSTEPRPHKDPPLPDDHIDWTRLMLRLLRLRRVVNDPMPWARLMRGELDKGEVPVPLEQVAALASPLIDEDARYLAGFVNAIAFDLAHPSGVPPD